MTTGAKSLPTISFSCTRCGACCNSAPQLSLPELFYHQDRFVGCLSLRRVAPLAKGASLDGVTELTAADSREFSDWVLQYFHQAQGLHGSETISLLTQAYDEPSTNRCPLLTQDNLCALEHDHKPLGCRAVPLDPLLPDSLQHHLLRGRATEAAYMGANCISIGAHPQAPLLVHGNRVTEASAQRDLDERRTALVLDKQYWGVPVFELLRQDLFDHPERVSGLPGRDYLSLSLAPALSALCVTSSRVRLRVIEYLTAQIELLAATLSGSPQKPSSVEHTLLGFFRANLALRAALQRARDDQHATPQARQVEAWLGIPA